MLLVNKPKGWTSFDAVAYIRGRVGRRATVIPATAGIQPLDSRFDGNDKKKLPRVKVGHAGTLDPFATGLLIVAVGREETKRLDEFKNLPKTYVATIRLGAISDTMDSTGRIEDYKIKRLKDLRVENNETMKQLSNLTIEQLNNGTIPKLQEVENTLNLFRGKQLQLPPMFSAKSINGVRLYKLARKGVEVKREPNEIEILEIKLLNYSYPELKIEVTCTAGTYIRTLAHDIGQKLGVGAYCDELVRTRIGEFELEDAQELSAIDFNQKLL